MIAERLWIEGPRHGACMIPRDRWQKPAPPGVLDGDGNSISGGPDVRRTTIMAALGAALATSFATVAGPANAAVGSASITGTTATLNFDGADDNETVSVSGGLLV